MPVAYVGFRTGTAAANGALRSPKEKIEPIPEGVHPLDAIDAETRDLIVNWRTAPEVEERDVTFADRIGGALIGAGFGAVIGFLALNGMGRGMYRRPWSAKPMNAQATLAWAGIGAAIGAISGFARGRSPLEKDPKERIDTVLPTAPGPLGGTSGPIAAASGAAAAGAAHPAFASLYG